MRAQTVLFLAATVACAQVVQVPLQYDQPTKRIAIVGMGAGGIASLRGLMTVPEDMRQGWEVTAFDEREAVGGLWVPQDDPPAPPVIPATPLYPNLRTNGPHISTTVPNIPLPPNTPLLAPRAKVLEYHQGIYNATPLPPSQLYLQHSVKKAEWIGNAEHGWWKLAVTDLVSNANRSFAFDHLLVAPGINRIPRIPHFEGQEEWLASGKILFHCMWYRDPKPFTGKTTLVVGGGPSGLDMSRHLLKVAKKIYWANADGLGLTVPGAEPVDRLASLVNGVATLRNGTTLPDVEAIILATGYSMEIPFLTAGGVMDLVSSNDAQPDTRLTTNGRYIRPLYEHTVSLDPRYPPGALHFNSLLTYNPTGSTNYAQALFTAYTLANPSLLGTREKLLAGLKKREDIIRANGIEPSRLGHKIVTGYGKLGGHLSDGPYQDLLVHSLRDGGLAGYPGIPDFGFNFTETWRVWAMRHAVDVLDGWFYRLQKEGDDAWEQEYVSGQRTEADYLDAMRRFVEWWAENNATEPRSSQRTASARGLYF